MPAYVYKCSECERIWEETQKMSDPSLTECIDHTCIGTPHRVPQPFGAHYRGTGWSQDDKWRYRRAPGSPSIHGT